MSIVYGGGSETKTISFAYESRPDISEGYSRGYLFRTDKRLSSITVSLNNSHSIRKYNITYNEDASQNSRIEKIEECGSTSIASNIYSECLPPIKFDWDIKNQTNGFNTVPTDFSTYAPSHYSTSHMEKFKYGDFNGDGKADVYYVKNGLDAVHLSKGDGTFTEVPGINSSISTSNLPYPLIDISRIKFGDFNGDGKTDIYQVNGWDRNLEVQDIIHLSNGDGTYKKINGLKTVVWDSGSRAPIWIARIKFGDFNGDGKTDIYYVKGWNSTAIDKIYLSNGDGTYLEKNGLSTHVLGSDTYGLIWISKIKLGDFNGDGKTDIYYVNGWDSTAVDKIHLSNGDGTYQTPIDGLNTRLNDNVLDANVTYARLNFGDFNGDGITDIYYINATAFAGQTTDRIYIFHDNGAHHILNGLRPTDIGEGVNRLGEARYKFGDFNGDGRTDIYYINGWGTNATDTVFYFNGSDFTTRKNTAHSTNVRGGLSYYENDLSRIRLGDFNGDGMMDVFRIEGENSSVADNIYMNVNGTDEITGITNGLSPKTSIAYENQNGHGADVYNTGEEVLSEFERTIVGAPIRLVKTVTRGNGIGGVNIKGYQYQDLRVGRQGRGIRGFKKFEITDYTKKMARQ